MVDKGCSDHFVTLDKASVVSVETLDKSTNVSIEKIDQMNSTSSVGIWNRVDVTTNVHSLLLLLLCNNFQ